MEPKYMTQQYFNTLNAGCEVVTMRQLSTSMYENVNKICEYMTDDAGKKAVKLFQ